VKRVFAAIGVALVVIGIIIGIFALTVGLSGIVGKGNAHIQKENSTNRIDQNSQFYDLKSDYDATVNKIEVFKQAAAANPTDRQTQIDLTGVESHCLTVVGDYAAQSGKYISKDFKDADLPESLDASACH
jgi:hypothetical protein